MAHNPNPSHKKNILPGLQVPSGINAEVEKFLRAVKTYIEQFTGARGQPKERFATLADLEKANLASIVVKGGRGEIGKTAERSAAEQSSSSTGSGFTPDTTGAKDGDVLRYVAAQDSWRRYELLDADGVVLEAAIPTEFKETRAFTEIIVGDLQFSSAADLTAALGTFTDVLQGVVPASGGGTTNFLRADGTWAEPPGGSSGGGALVYANTSVPAGNTVANTTTETALESTYTIPADQLEQGTVVRTRLAGTYSTAAVAPTLRVRVKLAGTTILDSGVVTLGSNEANAGWWADTQLVIHTTGVTGTLDAQGLLSAGGMIVHLASTAVASIDTTDAAALTVTVEWGAASTDNTITLREMLVYMDAGGDPTPYVLKSTLTTDGDLLVRSGGSVTRLPVGSEDQVLKVVSGVPAWAADGGGSGPSNATPTITTIAPDEGTAGDSDTQITITGTGFTYWSLVLLDDVPVATTYNSATELIATIPAASLASSGTVGVKVASPLPGGGTTAAVDFTVNEAAGDPNFANVVLLLGLDGADGAAATTDESTSAHTVTVNGNAQLDTAQKKFGTAALLLDGVGDFLSISSSADFAIAGDYTIEGFFYSVDVTANKALVQLQINAANRITIGHNNDMLYFYSETTGGGGATRIQGGTPLDATWHHFALTKESGVWRLFLDGTLIGTSSTSVFPTGNLAAYIGRSGTSGSALDFNGWLDEIRFTKGVARYTATFTPPSELFPRS